MELERYFRRSIRSLALHGLRTLLSTLGILFGVVAVVAMLSIGEGAKRETLEQIEQLGINTMTIRQNELSPEQQQQAREKRSRGLTLEDAFVIQQGVPNIIASAPTKVIKASLPGTLQNTAPEILAVTRTYGEIKEIKLEAGRFICDTDQNTKKHVCVLGSDVAQALGQSGHLGNSFRIEGKPFQIVGIVQRNLAKVNKNAFLSTKNLNQMIFIPLGTEGIFNAYPHPQDVPLSEIILRTKPNEDIIQTGKVVKGLLNHFHKGFEDYQIVIPKELLNQANQTQRTFNLVLGSIAAISLLVGGIGIMNMMLANVSERTREIGIRRALGATRKDIMLQFLTETLLLTLFGALLGVFIGIGFSLAISYFAGWKTIVTFWSILLSLGMAGGVGLCSGLYPAYQAAALHPIVALRHV